MSLKKNFVIVLPSEVKRSPMTLNALSRKAYRAPTKRERRSKDARAVRASME